MTFENQTTYLPCAMQSINLFQPTNDQLTLILWYRSWNTTNGPPIYSIDFRNSENFGRLSFNHQSAIHFISNDDFKNRILFEFDTCWLTESYEKKFWANRAFNLTGHQINSHHLNNFPLNYHFNYHLNNTRNSLKTILRPICAFLKLDQIKKTDAGRYSCRIDFRRSRTFWTQLTLKVLGNFDFKYHLKFDLKFF